MICPTCKKEELFSAKSHCHTCFDERPMCATLDALNERVLCGSSLQDLCIKAKNYMIEHGLIWGDWRGGLVCVGDKFDMKQCIGRMNSSAEVYKNAWERIA